jgi:hypothetical protein
MTLYEAVSNLYDTYGQYGLDRGKLGLLICDGMENHGLSLEACYNGLRMALGNEYNKQERFNADEIAEMLDMSETEVMQMIENYKTDLEAKGEDTGKCIF